MEERSWVLNLSPGAQDCCFTKASTQPSLLSQGSHQTATKKRTLQEMGFVRMSQKETENEDRLSSGKKIKKARMADGLIRSRPILRDVVNNAK